MFYEKLGQAFDIIEKPFFEWDLLHVIS